MPFRLYPHCLPYRGPGDPGREQAVAAFLRAQLDVQDVVFAEEDIPDSGAVRPAVSIGYELETHEPHATHEQFMVAVDTALRATGMQPTGGVVTERQPAAVAARLAGGAAASFAGLAGLAGLVSVWNGKPSEGQITALVLSSFALSALFGGCIGGQIATDGRIVGYWRRARGGLWRWSPTEQLLAAHAPAAHGA